MKMKRLWYGKCVDRWGMKWERMATSLEQLIDYFLDEAWEFKGLAIVSYVLPEVKVRWLIEEQSYNDVKEFMENGIL